MKINQIVHLSESVSESTGDKPFDQMMTTIKQGTNKQKTADRKEQQKQTQQQARNAFGNMFGGGNPADKLKIREQGVAEGAPELLKKEMPLHRHAEKLLAQNGVSKDDPDYHHHLGNTIKHLRQFGNIDLINKQGVAEEGYGNDPSQRVDPRTGKKYVPPKSPLGQGVAEGGFPKKISQKEVDKFQKKHNDKLTGREVNRQEQEKKPADNTKKQGVAEGVAETVSMDQAKKVLRHYGADHFKTTTNELHFYKNGRPMSVDLIFNDDATRSVNLSQLNSSTRRLKGQGVAEAEKKGLYYYVNKRKKAGTSRDADSPKAPTAQAWKDAAKTAKTEGVAESKLPKPYKKWAS